MISRLKVAISLFENKGICNLDISCIDCPLYEDIIKDFLICDDYSETLEGAKKYLEFHKIGKVLNVI